MESLIDGIQTDLKCSWVCFDIGVIDFWEGLPKERRYAQTR